MQPLSTQALAIVPIDRQSLDTAVPSHQPAMTDATISFLDGTSVKAKADLTVREVRKALTPRNKLYAHLDLCYKTNVLGGDETVGSRHLQGVWRRVKRVHPSLCSADDPHLWEPVYLDGRPTGLRKRIATHSFSLEIYFEESLIFNKTIHRCPDEIDEGYCPSTTLKLAFLQLREPNPGPSCHPDWKMLYIDRVWVSRDLGFWAHPEDCLECCGVAPGTVLTAYMERLNLDHETPPGDTEERRARIRAALKRKREER